MSSQKWSQEYYAPQVHHGVRQGVTSGTVFPRPVRHQTGGHLRLASCHVPMVPDSCSVSLLSQAHTRGPMQGSSVLSSLLPGVSVVVPGGFFQSLPASCWALKPQVGFISSLAYSLPWQTIQVYMELDWLSEDSPLSGPHWHWTGGHLRLFFSGSVRLLITQMLTGQNTEGRHGLFPLCHLLMHMTQQPHLQHFTGTL